MKMFQLMGPAMFALAISGCGGNSSGPAPAKQTQPASAASSSQPSSRGPNSFVTVSGSENKDLEPILQEFARQRGTRLDVKYKGSVDIMLDLDAGKAMEADALWPANSLWITLGDSKKVVKHVESVMQSPVVFGVKRSVAQALGWIGREVKIADILAAAEGGHFKFAMTSATQSNSGAAGYFGFLYALAGSPDVLTLETLNDTAVQEKVRRLLAQINRSSGSSGWLKDMVISRYDALDGMVNYESMIIEANRELEKSGREPMMVIYPVDGIMISDSPLVYIHKGDEAKEAFFNGLVEYMKSDDVQKKILASGRRTGLGGVDLANADKRVFNPDWGIDLKRVLAPVPTPAEPVIRAALELYQEGGLRKPSLTAYVLDFSGSMKGNGGEKQLKQAMSLLLDPVESRRYMIQPSARDIHIIIPFDGHPRATMQATGNDSATLKQFRDKINALAPNDGTDIYTPTALALNMMRQQDLSKFCPAIILMTDGQSQGSIDALMSEIGPERDIPVFCITFGEADDRQLKKISELCGGRVFDGTKDLRTAFRSAKGYN